MLSVIKSSQQRPASDVTATTTNLFSAIKETEQLYIMRQQRKATRESMRLHELVAYAITKSYKPIIL